jgi:CARDB.
MAVAGCSGGQDTNEEPEFEIREVRSSPSIAQSGEKITAAATISNVGEAPGTTSVEFSLDVVQSSAETETINPGSATQITTDIEIPLIDSERYDLTATLDEQTSSSTPVDIYEELNENGLHGSVVSRADISLEGSGIRIILTSGEFADNEVTVDNTGRFFSPHLKSVNYALQATFYAGETASEFDKIPYITPLQNEYSVTNDVEILEQYEIPEGHRTKIKLVDSEGVR